ncbi:MAG: PaaI family thioesterase [Alphaproteobacteria bacterium]
MPDTPFEPKNPDYAARCRESFSRQPFMAHLGATLRTIRPGFCEIALPSGNHLRQQHGYYHGGSIASVLDSAAGYAAFSLMPADVTILTVEYKLNFLLPGEGEELIARGQVVKPGRTLTVVQADAFAVKGGVERMCATSIQTLMALPGRPDGSRIG